MVRCREVPASAFQSWLRYTAMVIEPVGRFFISHLTDHERVFCF